MEETEGSFQCIIFIRCSFKQEAFWKNLCRNNCLNMLLRCKENNGKSSTMVKQGFFVFVSASSVAVSETFLHLTSRNQT